MRKVIYAISIAMFLGASLASCGSDGFDNEMNETRFPDGSTFKLGDGPEIALNDDGDVTLAAREYYGENVLEKQPVQNCLCCRKLYVNGITDGSYTSGFTNNCNYNGVFVPLVPIRGSSDIRANQYKCRDLNSTALLFLDCSTFNVLLDGETF